VITQTVNQLDIAIEFLGHIALGQVSEKTDNFHPELSQTATAPKRPGDLLLEKINVVAFGRCWSLTVLCQSTLRRPTVKRLLHSIARSETVA
jgi:hypothetical protein